MNNASDAFGFQSDGAGYYRVLGRLDFETVPLALDESMRLFADQASIELDMAGVTDAGSAALSLLIEWTSWARRGHRSLQFRNLPRQLEALAGICDVHAMLPVAKATAS